MGRITKELVENVLLAHGITSDTCVVLDTCHEPPVVLIDRYEPLKPVAVRTLYDLFRWLEYDDEQAAEAISVRVSRRLSGEGVA